jgi:hypothetical protein
VRARIAAFVSLVLAVTALVGIAFLIALVYHLTGANWQRAILIVFLIGGAGLVAFAVLTHGAEQKGASMFDFALERVYRVPPDERMKLNPTGVLVVAGIVLAAIGLVVDAVAR